MSAPEKYPLMVFNSELKLRLQPAYSLEELQKLKNFLAPALAIRTREGIVSASNRSDSEGDDPTHYDAVWLRDSMWIYLGLKNEEPAAASSILWAMLNYMSSKAQLDRLHRIIRNPKLAQGDQGAMEVLHIRFDGKSKEFADVFEQGKPQYWNHKQNDAVALFYLCALRALSSGEIKMAELKAQHVELLTQLPQYFLALKFYEMEDAGAWEEINRLNTSSVALVTAALEELSTLIHRQEFSALGLHAGEALLKDLVGAGYARIRKQLPLGESPDHPTNGQKYREADAALLNVIYPAELNNLTTEEKALVLGHVKKLVREVGVIRYKGDAYQATGYWQASLAHTDDFSTSEKFAERAKAFAENSEAQWFFDSWLALCYGIVGDHSAEVVHLNRALAQLTGGQEKTPPVGADGKVVASFAFPESYNVVVEKGLRAFRPSPITPLNWAKASLRLALDALAQRLQEKT